MSYAISNLSELPSIAKVKKISQALALADAILMPDWAYRYFSFNNAWNEGNGDAMASMRDGEGDEYFLHFGDIGAAGKVLSKSKLRSALDDLNEIPDTFSEFKRESAFSLEDASFYFWCLDGESVWSASPASIESFHLLGFIAGDDETYRNWAEAYYEREINPTALKEIFNKVAINAEVLQVLNPKLTMQDLQKDLVEILG